MGILNFDSESWFNGFIAGVIIYGCIRALIAYDLYKRRGTKDDE